MWVLPTHYSSPWNTPVWSLPWGAGCSRVNVPQGCKSWQQTCSIVSSSPQVSRFWQDPDPAQASHRVIASFRCIHLPQWGPPQALGGSLLPHGSPWAAGAQLPHQGLHHRLQGNLSSGSAWSTSCPSFCTVLGVCSVTPLICSHSGLLRSQLQKHNNFLFIFYLKYIITETSPLFPIGSDLASSRPSLEPPGIGSADTEETSSSFLQKPLL